MVVHISVILLLGLSSFLSPVQAVISGDIYGPLVELVVKHLNGSHLDWDNWTTKMSLTLESKQQKRVAWNIPWSHLLEDEKSPLEVQQQLSPGNSFKLRLWMSYYWYLRRSQLMNGILLANFALELGKLQRNKPEVWNNDVQNMWQSLPRSLRILLKSRTVCLQHKKEMLYVAAEKQLILGANSNCSMWVVDDRNDHQLELMNFCDDKTTLFIRTLSPDGSHVLLSVRNNLDRHFCVLNGMSFYEEVSEASEMESRCHWQINDCTFLPFTFSAYNKI
ncbi:uncharacterized protein LOC108143692 [Drosophila elegans]|uniref:uncharacterized protein LOC108143692 n=1 Tax=Drosophila elegans TaxID=30023 RepID=UPI0007E61397|nr:uncharacterized protein LOC108143692 [Drosophila elegans]